MGLVAVVQLPALIAAVTDRALGGVPKALGQPLPVLPPPPESSEGLVGNRRR